jgi:MFS family permease
MPTSAFGREAFIVVGAVWVTLAIASGLYFSFPIFFVALLEEFGWSRGATAAAFSISSIVQGVLSPVVGTLVDRLGPRRVMLGGACILGTACALSSRIQSLGSLYLIVGVLAAAGACAVSWVPTGALIARWFTERRGSAMGVAFSGMGAGVFVIGPLTQWLIATSSWRTATLLLGLGALVLLLPLVLWGIRDRPPADARHRLDNLVVTETLPAAPATGAEARAKREATLAEALRTRAFWAMFAAYFFTPLAVFPVATHAVAFAVDRGYPAMLAASAFGAMGLMSSVGRVGFGLAADRFGGPLAATLSFGCTAGGTAALLALEVLPGAGWLVVFSVLFGLGFGARGPIITAMAAERFGGRRFGVIYGALNLGNGLAGALGPWFGGAVHDITGSYRLAFAAAIVFSACGAVCFWLTRGRAP